jgi:hypothetical protein
MNKPLRLGIIGISDGNGHPYSWSAIFNGYNSFEMEGCGFPSIPRYLERQNFPCDTIDEAVVTHIYTQDHKLSRHIALSCNIKYIVDNPIDMIGQVDGILLARDDSENHIHFAKPFLMAGVPIYIDKPFALSVKIANQMLGMQQYPGQIFSCSALRYAKEFDTSLIAQMKLGDIRAIHGFSPKSWDKYSIHVIEPILNLIPNRGFIKKSISFGSHDRRSLLVAFSSGVDIQIHTQSDGISPIGLRIFGSEAWVDVNFVDVFTAFREALYQFTQGIIMKDVRSPPEDLLSIVEIIELGCNA